MMKSKINPLDFHVRCLWSFFGLGFGAERSKQCNDDFTLSWWAIHCKVFIGPLIFYWTIPLSKFKAELDKPVYDPGGDWCSLSWCYIEGAYDPYLLGDEEWLTGCPRCGCNCWENPSPYQIAERDAFYNTSPNHGSPT